MTLRLIAGIVAAVGVTAHYNPEPPAPVYLLLEDCKLQVIVPAGIEPEDIIDRNRLAGLRGPFYPSPECELSMIGDRIEIQ